MRKSWVSRRIPSLYSAPSLSDVLGTEVPRVAGSIKSCRVLQVQVASCDRVLFIASRLLTMPFDSRTVLSNQARSAGRSSAPSHWQCSLLIMQELNFSSGIVWQKLAWIEWDGSRAQQAGEEVRAVQPASDMGTHSGWACFSTGDTWAMRWGLVMCWPCGGELWCTGSADRGVGVGGHRELDDAIDRCDEAQLQGVALNFLWRHQQPRKQNG